MVENQISESVLQALDWRVHSGGYRWVREPATSIEGRTLRDMEGAHMLLTPNDGLGVGPDHLKLESARPGLFREFAKVENANAALDFANANGLLGLPIVLSEPARKRPLVLLPAEPWAVWRDEAAEMRALLELWELQRRALSRDQDPIAQAKLVEQLRALLQERHRASIATIRDLSRPDVIHLAALTLADSVSRRLQGKPDGLLPALGGAAATLQWDSGSMTFGLRFAPTSLLAALWLQFASALTEQKQYRECMRCKRPVEIAGGRGGRRSQTKFCSDKCRYTFHNENAALRKGRKKK